MKALGSEFLAMVAATRGYTPVSSGASMASSVAASVEPNHQKQKRRSSGAGAIVAAARGYAPVYSSRSIICDVVSDKPKLQKQLRRNSASSATSGKPEPDKQQKRNSASGATSSKPKGQKQQRRKSASDTLSSRRHKSTTSPGDVTGKRQQIQKRQQKKTSSSKSRREVDRPLSKSKLDPKPKLKRKSERLLTDSYINNLNIRTKQKRSMQ